MLKQVNKLMTKTTNLILQQAVRNKSSKVLYPIERSAVRVEGPDAAGFLQGLTTNDMNHFDGGARSIYTMFLNTKGRVILDALIHKWKDPDYFIIECDKTLVGTLHAHLNIYKLKRNVQLQTFPHFKAWVVMVSDLEFPKWLAAQGDSVKYFKDPRLDGLGARLISPILMDGIPDIVNLLRPLCEISLISNEDELRSIRYSLGVGEGAADIPHGTSFPLEINCDYLHGVSFHKGCYIGQEVTARIYHTGVVRKRILPLRFGEQIFGEIGPNTPIKTKNNLTIGKLRGYCGGWGIGLMRIKEALESREVTVGHNTAEVYKPDWWPLEAPKEKIKPPTE